MQNQNEVNLIKPELLGSLISIQNNNVLSNPSDCEKYGGKIFWSKKMPPDFVCIPETSAAVIEIANTCLQHKTPIIPFGSGTSVEGQIAAVSGGVTISFERMNKILNISLENMTVTVEPGIAYNELNNILDAHNLEFPVEAGWGASIGGMVATNASGAGAVLAGAMKNNVLALKAVVFDGDDAKEINFGSKTFKTSAGYNLAALFCGSEGALGIITEVTLKLRKKAASRETLVCQFDNCEDAISAVIQMKDNGINATRAELLDALQTNAIIQFTDIKFFEKNRWTLLLEFSGLSGATAELSNLATNILKEKMPLLLSQHHCVDEQTTIWMARKKAGPSAMALDPQRKPIATDVCVPLNSLALTIKESMVALSKANLTAPFCCHVGDGNFHFTILVSETSEQEKTLSKLLTQSLVEIALKNGGTSTGEHGVGIGKAEYLLQEHADSIFLMKKIKNAFDPHNLLNPGKLFGVQNIATTKYKGKL